MRICVFCGSSPGNLPSYQDAAVEVGELLAREGIELVYGGGNVGLMGIVADAALDAGGDVTGVMPRHLVESEISHKGLTTLEVVEDMHERKMKMSELSDAFLTLPGGAGTLEEITEQWTWAQLGIHTKPCAFYNVGGYYDHLHAMIDKIVEAGFMKASYADMLIYGEDAKSILAAFKAYKAPARKWLKE